MCIKRKRSTSNSRSFSDLENCAVCLQIDLWITFGEISWLATYADATSMAENRNKRDM